MLAVKTNGKVPVEEGVPEITNWPALGVNIKPDGGVPDVRLIVGAGLPVAVTVKLFEEPVENVVAAALVNAGAGLRFRVKVAVSADSVGTVVAPQEPSASTAAVETLFKLMTYGPAVALACGASVNVASNWFAALATGAELVPPKSATITFGVPFIVSGS